VLSPEGVTVFEEVDDALISRLIDEQAACDGERSLLVVFDDVGEVLRHTDPQLINRFVSNSRHLSISIVLLLQKLTQAPTIFRCNTDCFICFAACAEVELRALLNEVSILDRRRFYEMFRDTTQRPYGFLVISIQAGKISTYRDFKAVV